MKENPIKILSDRVLRIGEDLPHGFRLAQMKVDNGKSLLTYTNEPLKEKPQTPINIAIGKLWSNGVVVYERRVHIK